MDHSQPELLTQEEIDALLAQLELEAGVAEGAPELEELFVALLSAARHALPDGGAGVSPRPALTKVAGSSVGEALEGLVPAWFELQGLAASPLLLAARPPGGESGARQPPWLEAVARAVAAELARRAGMDGGEVAVRRAAPGSSPATVAVARFAWQGAGDEGVLVLGLPAEPAAALREVAAATGPARAEAAVSPPHVPPAEPPLPELRPSPAGQPVGRIDLLLDVPLEVTVELGRTRRQLRELLALGPGSLVELDKLAGEAVDVLVNGKLIARGEVVVIDEYFGVRITEIVSPAERLQRLR